MKVLKFYATWCEPCKALSKIIEGAKDKIPMPIEDIDIEQNMIGTFMTFDFLHENKIFIRLACSCHFQIQKESWTNFISDKPTITVPKSFLLHLATITTGTSRGILHSKTEGTAFCTLVLPTIDLTQLISTDLDFPI